MYNLAQDYISSTDYLIMIDLTEAEFGVYHGFLDNWGLVWKAQCAVGAPETPTPVDATEVYEKYLWFDSGDVRLWYATPFNGSNYIHSVTYYPDDGPYEIEDPTVGAAISHGCIRLELKRAKWVYDNIPIGTLVVTYE